jgi:hypothetical protein
MLNQYPFQTQRSMMAVGMNSHHLSPTYLWNWQAMPPISTIPNTNSGTPFDS